MDWDATEAVVSIPSRVRGGVTTAHQSQPSPNSEQITDTHAQPYTVEDEDVVASESLPDTPNRSSSHTHTHAHTTPRSKRNSSGQFASPTPTTSNYAHATTVKKVRNSSIGNASVPQNRSKLLPPPPATSHPASPSATNSLYAAYTSAHAATSGDTPAPTKYLGMQAPKTEWLLPTRVSVQERTTTTTAAKLNYKSPKADKNWKGYIPANQSHPFDLHFHRPKVLEAPLAPLPGNKNEKYDGPLQRVPVSEAITRASLDKRNEKNIKSQRGLPSQAQLLEDEIESRRADKRARFEQMTEKQKEAIWREVTHLQQKQMMLAEERAFVEGLRAKIRQARIDREEKWKAEEMKMRQKENLELRIPEARLAKYERWMRQEQEAELREKYIRETGQQPPAGYGKQEEADDEDDADKDELDVSNLLDDSTLPTPQLPTLPRFPTMDHGRFVESSYHSGSSSIGIEFKMLSENDPEANAPLFAPPTVAPTAASITAAPSNTATATAVPATSVHSRGNGSIGTSTSSPVHHQRGPSSGHRTNVSSGSIGNLSQLGLSDGAVVQLEAAIESDHDDQPTDERKYSTHDQSPELSAQLRPTHAREPSHSAIRSGGGVPTDRNVAAGVSFAVDGDVDLDDLPAQSNSSRSGARSIGGVNVNTGGVSATGDHSREASRARESRGTLGGVRKEEAKAEPHDQPQPQSHALTIDANTPHGDETGDENTHKDYPPLAGNADEWDVDEQILSVGIQAIKIPRKKSMFGGPRQITLHLSQSTSIPPNWLLQWNSKSKKSEDEFINLTHGLKSYQRGLRDGALASCGKDVANKYLYRANHCYTLQLSDRTLDLVILENSHSNAFDRVLSRIDHPSGQYRTPRAAASSTPSSSRNIDETMNSEGPQSSPSAFAISARAPVGASATAHGVMSAHHPPQTGLAGGVTTPLGAASSASPTSTVTAANPALLLAMAAQSSSSKNIHHPQSPSLSHSNPNPRTPTASPPQLDRQPTSESKSRTNSNNIPTARQNDE